MNVETQLRDTLNRAADELGTTQAPEAVRAHGIRGLARARSRRRAAVLSAGLAAVVVAVATPIGLTLLQAPDGRPAGRPPAIPQVDIYGEPTRGSLAGDAVFVDAVRQLPWLEAIGPNGEQGFPGTPLAQTRRVVFAGDVPGGRWAMVVGPAPAELPRQGDEPTVSGPPVLVPLDELERDRETRERELAALLPVAWFAGPSGAAPEELQLVMQLGLLSTDQPTSLYNAATGALVVVAAPGDLIEVSERPQVAADGSVTRTYVDAGATDGVAVTAVEPNLLGASGGSVAYRVSRSGDVLAEDRAFSYPDPAAALLPQPQVELDYLRPPITSVQDGYLVEQQLAAEILGEYGLRPDQVDLQVNYVGPVPGVAGSSAQLTVVTAVFPSGARLTRTDVRDGPTVDTAVLGACGGGQLSAAEVPTAPMHLALRCEVSSMSAERQGPDAVSTLVVIAAPAMGAAVAVANGGSNSTTVDLDGAGIGMTPFPEGAGSVVIQSRDGTVLDEVPIGTP